MKSEWWAASNRNRWATSSESADCSGTINPPQIFAPDIDLKWRFIVVTSPAVSAVSYIAAEGRPAPHISLAPATVLPLLLELKRCVVDDLFHHEKGPGLAHAGERDQLLAMQSVEVGNISHSNLQKIVEVAGDQMAVEHEW